MDGLEPTTPALQIAKLAMPLFRLVPCQMSIFKRRDRKSVYCTIGGRFRSLEPGRPQEVSSRVRGAYRRWWCWQRQRNDGVDAQVLRQMAENESCINDL